MDDLTRQTLAWVNELRARYDIGPPLSELGCGPQMSSARCPVAQALQSSVGLTDTGASSNDAIAAHIMLPPFVTEWIRCFDRGEYPTLIDQ